MTHSKNPLVTESQVAFGRKLDIDLSGKSTSVAYAMIEDIIAREFWGETDLGGPSPKQIDLAQRFGWDITTQSRRVSFAVIDDIMHKLNMEAIELQRLAPGVRVKNRHSPLDFVEVISSIDEDGTCYLKGGNGKRVWARSLCRVDN